MAMPRLRIAFLVLLLIGGGFAVGCRETSPAATAGPVARVLPVELLERHLLLSTRVNGAGPYCFVFDTGAPYTVLSPACAAAPGVVRGAQVPAYGIGALRTTFDRLTGVTLNLRGAGGDVDLPIDWGTSAPQRVFDQISSAAGRRIDGILGYDLLARYVVEIDYDAAELWLYEPQGFRPPATAEVVPLNVDKGLGYVPAQIVPSASEPPIDCRLIVDTGAGMCVMLRKPFVEAHRLIEKVPTIGGRAMGVGGIADSRDGRVAELRVGSFALHDAPAAFAEAPDHLSGDGFLGGRTLARFRVTLDYPHQRMLLEPGQRFDDPPDEMDMSGIGLLAEGERLDQFRAQAVNPDSPAARADIQVGDTLIALDGKRSSGLTLPEVRDALSGPAGATRTLTLQRGDQTLERRIVLKRLI
jgi:hypothetical protein